MFIYSIIFRWVLFDYSYCNYLFWFFDMIRGINILLISGLGIFFFIFFNKFNNGLEIFFESWKYEYLNKWLYIFWDG